MVDLLARWGAALRSKLWGEEDSPRLRHRVREETERAVREQRTWVLEDEGRRSRAARSIRRSRKRSR